MNQKTQPSSFSFFSLKTVTEETETDREITESTDINADESTTKNKETATKSNTEIKERDRQTVTATVTATKTNIKTERMIDSEFKKNIRLLAAIQMMLKVLFIF